MWRFSLAVTVPTLHHRVGVELHLIHTVWNPNQNTPIPIKPGYRMYQVIIVPKTIYYLVGPHTE